MSAVLPFAYGDHAVRVVTLDDEPWFVLADLCKVLDLTAPHMVARRIPVDARNRPRFIVRRRGGSGPRVNGNGRLAQRASPGPQSPTEAGAQPPKEQYLMSLSAQPGEAWLYLAEIIDHGVKVGISRHPLRRLKNHDGDARAYGRRLGRTWVSPIPHVNARTNEAAIKRGARREYLDRSFDDCLAQAMALPMERESTPAGRSPINAFLACLQPGYGEWLDRKGAGS